MLPDEIASLPGCQIRNRSDLIALAHLSDPFGIIAQLLAHPRQFVGADRCGLHGAQIAQHEVAHALGVARIAREVENATIVFVVCDRGDRYLSTGVFPA